MEFLSNRVPVVLGYLGENSMGLNRYVIYFLSSFLAGCASSDYTKTVAHLDLQRFMIPWYVQAGRFTPFENNPYNSVESYTWNAKKEQIDIDFHYNKGAFDGPLKKLPQTAWVKDKSTNANWSVSPFWPLKFDYLVIALDKNYEWTVIGVPSQRYLWVMSRDPQFSRAKTDEILREVERSGYSVADIDYVEHKK